MKLQDKLIFIRNSLQDELSLEIMIKVIAIVFAFWSAASTPKNEGEFVERMYSPHATQVISIFRLLGVDVKLALESHFIQMQTGEGKSITLGVTATILALLGYNVSCICYSEYLSKRDFESFAFIFSLCDVKQFISYGTINQLCEQKLNENGDIRKAVKSFVNSGDINSVKCQDSQDKRRKQRKSALLIDEADVLFSESFYGQLYKPITQISSERCIQLLKHIYRERNSTNLNLASIKEREDYKQLVEELPAWKDLIDTEICKMLSDIVEFNDPAYIVEGNAIKYKEYDYISDKRRYRYKTSFAYIHENRKGNISDSACNKNLGINVGCGFFSYSKVPDRFSLILGVTGTLKCLSSGEKQIMSNYNIKKVTYLPSMFGSNKHNFTFTKDRDIVVAQSKSEQYHMLFDKISKSYQDGGAVLVFFKTKKELYDYKKSEQFSILLDAVGRENIQELIEESEFKKNIIQKATGSRQITLLTSSFGRGVDFTCYDSKVEQVGGVFVLQTYLSPSQSDEIQTKGRTARQQQSGRYALVLCESDLEAFSISSSECKRLVEMDGEKKYAFLHSKRNSHHAKQVQNMRELANKAEEDHKVTIAAIKIINSSTAKKEDIEKAILTINKTKKIAASFHIVLALDDSGSMSGQPWRDLCNAVDSFARSRIAMGATNDICSIINHSGNSKVMCSKVKIKKNLSSETTFRSGGNNFDIAIKYCDSAIGSTDFSTYAPVLLFMSDGGCGNGESEMKKLYDKYEQYNLQVFTIGFGSGCDKQKMLRLANQAGKNGYYSFGATATELKESFLKVSQDISASHL